MAKPIFIIVFPKRTKEQDMIDLQRINDTLQAKIPDYHVLCVIGESKELRFEAFYEKDFNHVKFEELKDIVKNIINGK